MIDKQKIDRTHMTYWNTCLMSSYAVCCNYYTQYKIEDYFDDYVKEFKRDFSDPISFFNDNNEYVSRFVNIHTFVHHLKNEFKIYMSDYQQYIDGVIDIDNWMKRYADIFVIQFHIRTYPNFIPFNETQTQKSGYEFLKILHNNISENKFYETRNKLTVEYIGKEEDDSLTKNSMNITTTEQLKDLMKEDEVIINAMYCQQNGVHSCTVYYDLNSMSFWLHDTNIPLNDSVLPDNWIEQPKEFLVFQKTDKNK